MKVLHEKGYIHVVEIPRREIEKIDFDICKQPKETISNYYKRQEVKPDIVCNAGFFDMPTGLTIFNYIDDHKVASSNPLFKWGIGIGNNDVDLMYGYVDDGNEYKDFICGYPVLLTNYGLQYLGYTPEIRSRNPRTAIGYNDEYFYIVAIDGRKTGKPGMTLDELAEYMKSIGCTYAINLDGGGSSRVHVDNKAINTPLENRAVDSVIAVYLKKEEKAPEYNVGDIVYFSGGNTYSSSSGGSASDRRCSFCTVTKKVDAKYGYHLISLPGEYPVYGWASSSNIHPATDQEKLIMGLVKKGVISDRSYWLSVLESKQPASVDNILALLNKVYNKIV